jgi:hypothetical protein
VSKFDKIFEAKNRQTKSVKAQRARAASGTAAIVSNDTAEQSVVRRGRPSGKRSNPEYIGFTTYIRRETSNTKGIR